MPDVMLAASLAGCAASDYPESTAPRTATILDLT